MISRFRRPCLFGALTVAALATGFATVAEAATLRFDTDPFAGPAGALALQTPGGQVVQGEANGELFVPVFDLETDLIEVVQGVFDVESEISFFDGLVADLPDQRHNIIVLRDLDDADLTNGSGFAAPLARNVIADRITQSGAGFFVYFNTGLNVARLVYSTDLSSRDADLKVLARFRNQTAQVGIDNLDEWTPENFRIVSAAVPEPGAWALLILGFGMAGGAMRAKRRLATA